MIQKRQIGLLVLAAVAVLLFAALPWAIGPYALGVWLSLLMWIALAESWAMFSGLSGYVSLGHAVFYGVGAYVIVLLWQVVPLWLAIPLGGARRRIVGAGTGLAMPAGAWTLFRDSDARRL